MPEPKSARQIYRLFSDLLAYPQPDLPERARACLALLTLANPRAAAPLARFCTFVEQNPLGRQEEFYTAAFDLQAVCHLYVGYHLFGESYRRVAFLVRLKERFREHGFVLEDEFGNELPDHLAVILRFLVALHECRSREELIAQCLAPALAIMVSTFGDEGNPYGDVVRALSLALHESKGNADPASVGASRRSDWLGEGDDV